MKWLSRVTVAVVMVAAAVAAQSLGDVARQQRSKRSQSARVFTNDDLPHAGMISSMGQTPSADGSKDASKADDASAKKSDSDSSKTADNTSKTDANNASTAGGDDEASWRQRFAKAREELALDQRELDVAQRELNTIQQQYYSDPNRALREQHDRNDINNRTQAIDSLKAKVDADQTSISGLEDELRKKGLPPGWARP